MTEQSTTAKKAAAKKATSSGRSKAPAKSAAAKSADAVETTQVSDQAPAEATTGDADRDAVIRASYQHASKVLKEQHLAEFNRLRKEFCDSKGVAWTPALTEEEKADKALRELVAGNPSLAAKYGIELDGEAPADAG